MISIRINGGLEDITKVSYDQFSIDKKQPSGNSTYELNIDFEHFERFIKPIYEQNKEELLKSGFFPSGKPVSFREWVMNNALFNNVSLNWFGYAIIKPFLEGAKEPSWYVKSIDSLRYERNQIYIRGTISSI